MLYGKTFRGHTNQRSKMPSFLEKFFTVRGKKNKGSFKRKVMNLSDNEASNVIFSKNEFDKHVPIKDVEDYMIRQFFKTKKKSLTNQRVSKK